MLCLWMHTSVYSQYPIIMQYGDRAMTCIDFICNPLMDAFRVLNVPIFSFSSVIAKLLKWMKEKSGAYVARHTFNFKLHFEIFPLVLFCCA